jgi:hypothetical protein
MCSIETLKKIKDTIEKFNKQQQLDILKLFTMNNVKVSENSNGCFINLTELEESEVLQIQEYILFVNAQDAKLTNIETTKRNIELEFFNKKNKPKESKESKES